MGEKPRVIIRVGEGEEHSVPAKEVGRVVKDIQEGGLREEGRVPKIEIKPGDSGDAKKKP